MNALQARDTYQGVARLEATDSVYSQDSIMLTCTPMVDTATADSADTWQVITLRISSAYPKELPSVVVRMSRDAQLAPQVSNRRTFDLCMAIVYALGCSMVVLYFFR